jgi:hypothetical protein
LALLFCATMLVIGVQMIRDGDWRGWYELVVFGTGLIALGLIDLPSANCLQLGAEGFEVRRTYRGSRTAWSEVKRLYLTADGRTVIYEPVTNPGETHKDGTEDPDEDLEYLPDSYGLSAPELLEVLNRYKQFADRPRP